MQKLVRGFLARRRLQHYIQQEQESSALLIQTRWRGYYTRKKYMANHVAQSKTSLIAQSLWRRHVCQQLKKEMKERDIAARVLGNYYRIHMLYRMKRLGWKPENQGMKQITEMNKNKKNENKIEKEKLNDNEQQELQEQQKDQKCDNSEQQQQSDRCVVSVPLSQKQAVEIVKATIQDKDIADKAEKLINNKKYDVSSYIVTASYVANEATQKTIQEKKENEKKEKEKKQKGKKDKTKGKKEKMKEKEKKDIEQEEEQYDKDHFQPQQQQNQQQQELNQSQSLSQFQSQLINISPEHLPISQFPFTLPLSPESLQMQIQPYIQLRYPSSSSFAQKTNESTTPSSIVYKMPFVYQQSEIGFYSNQ
ncbi:MAG: hypothetical protein EZS28_001096 [Streblomastix strix]|uniref:IQ calmodulin-binding motif family protein n=1 Tax=Streblomastix strix TaxID=222440 RepID=A0A5J4X992_9EUKA|nr:MAG: hypothetical protein EZS28_001096 [Streblomastix strix]